MLVTPIPTPMTQDQTRQTTVGTLVDHIACIQVQVSTSQVTGPLMHRFTRRHPREQ